VISGKLLALDIGHRYIHIAEGKMGKKQMDISNYAVIDTPESSVKEGMIVDSLVLKKTIESVLKTNHFKNDRAVISIKSPQIIVKDFILPLVKQEEYRSMVQLEMEQYVPNLATDYTFGFVLQDNPANMPGEMLMVKAYAMPKRLIAEYSEVLKGAGLKPLVIDSHTNTTEKLARRIFFPDGSGSSNEKWRTAGLIDFGYEFTDLNIIRGGKSVFNRLISTGCGKLWSDIARKNNLSLTQAEAVVSKETDLRTVDDDRIQEAVRAYANRLLGEIQTNIQFYIGRNQENKPDVLYIYGGFSRLKGFAELISSTLDLPVKYLDDIPIISKRIANQEKPMDYAQFINAFGAFIRND
jgi:type IV pilus assembly protein PilM